MDTTTWVQLIGLAAMVGLMFGSLLTLSLAIAMRLVSYEPSGAPDPEPTALEDCSECLRIAAVWWELGVSGLRADLERLAHAHQNHQKTVEESSGG